MEPCSKIHVAAATSIINLLEDCTIDHMEKLGLNIDLINQISELNLTGRRFIREKAPNFLSLQFNSDILKKQISEFKERKSIQEQEDQFLLLKAPSKMMHQLFGMHTTEFCDRRRDLNLSGGQHRHSYCDKETELIIWKLWKENESINERDRYLKIAELTNQNLNTIWQAIKYYYELA